MPSLAAIALAALLILALLAPAAFYALRGRGLRAAAPVYALLLAGAALWHVGIGFGEAPEPGAAAAAGGQGPASDAAAVLDAPVEEQCREALDLADRGGLILDRSEAGRVAVRGEYWSQMPERAQQALLACVRAQSGLAPAAPIEVVQR